MRLKSELWVKAYVRQCLEATLGVYVRHRGDSDAGIVLIKVDCLNDDYILYGPAIGASFAENGDRQWQCLTDVEGVDEQAADAIISQQMSFDPDIWVIVVEDRHGKALLGDAVIAV